MAQQTGVKLLLEYIEQRIYKVNQLDDGIYLDENIYLSLPKDEFEKIKEQAKAMEKEQIINASRQFADYPFDENDIQQYYNETYNK
jgi:hypothetical protein